MTAFALVNGRVDLENLTESALEDRAVLEVAARIEAAETLPDTPGNPPAEIEVHTERGRVLKSPPFSDAMLSVSEKQIREKFLSSMSYAARAHEASSLWELVSKLDATPISRILERIPNVSLENT